MEGLTLRTDFRRKDKLRANIGRRISSNSVGLFVLGITEDGHELGLGIDFLRLGHHDSREDAGGLVPALVQVIDGPLVDFLGPISGALVATDVHSDLLLELVNAEHVHGLEAQAEGGEHEGSPTKDEKDRKYLDTEKGAVTAVKPGQRRTQDENILPRKRREKVEANKLIEG
jgi:hypothetical protein